MKKITQDRMEKMRQHTSHSQTRTELRHPHFVYMSEVH